MRPTMHSDILISFAWFRRGLMTERPRRNRNGVSPSHVSRKNGMNRSKPRVVLSAAPARIDIPIRFRRHKCAIAVDTSEHSGLLHVLGVDLARGNSCFARATNHNDFSANTNAPPIKGISRVRYGPPPSPSDHHHDHDHVVHRRYEATGRIAETLRVEMVLLGRPSRTL
jgi:hypothetical protein